MVQRWKAEAGIDKTDRSSSGNSNANPQTAIPPSSPTRNPGGWPGPIEKADDAGQKLGNGDKEMRPSCTNPLILLNQMVKAESGHDDYGDQQAPSHSSQR